MQMTVEALLNGTEYRRLSEHATMRIQKEYKLCKIDLYILTFLNRFRDKNTPRDILASKMFTRGHISQSIKRLVSQNFISTETDSNDHRIFHCYLTSKAESVLIELEGVMHEMEQQIFQHVSEEEKILFLEVANRINRNIVNVLD